MSKMIQKYNSLIGCDPEFFFQTKSRFASRREVVESSKALEKGNLEIGDAGYYGKVIRDGFQGEFNPRADTCRQRLANYIGMSVKKVDDLGYNMLLGAGYWVPEAKFASLGDDSKVFGCNPSENIYGEQGAILDASRYMFRPVGGHIHLSLGPTLKKQIPKLVRLLDIFVGNTVVPFDQDPLQVERRKNYGRAGEYRVKPYGVEYRTLSNFWLRHYRFMGLTFGLARMAMSVLAYKGAVADQIIADFKGPDIALAINNNDKELAIKNFLKLRPYIDSIFNVEYVSALERFPITDLVFDKTVNLMRDGLKFKQEGHGHWLNIGSELSTGWERFILQGVDLGEIKNDYVW